MGKSIAQHLGIGSKKSKFGWNWRITGQTGNSAEVSVLMDIREIFEHMYAEQIRTNELLTEILENGS